MHVQGLRGGAGLAVVVEPRPQRLLEPRASGRAEGVEGGEPAGGQLAGQLRVAEQEEVEQALVGGEQTGARLGQRERALRPARRGAGARQRDGGAERGSHVLSRARGGEGRPPSGALRVADRRQAANRPVLRSLAVPDEGVGRQVGRQALGPRVLEAQHGHGARLAPARRLRGGGELRGTRGRLGDQQLEQATAPLPPLAGALRGGLRVALGGGGRELVDVGEDRLREGDERGRWVAGALRGVGEPPPRGLRPRPVGGEQRVERPPRAHLAAPERHVDLARGQAGPGPGAHELDEPAERLLHPHPHGLAEAALERRRVGRHAGPHRLDHLVHEPLLEDGRQSVSELRLELLPRRCCFVRSHNFVGRGCGHRRESWRESALILKSMSRLEKYANLAAVAVPFLAFAVAVVLLWQTAVGPLDLALLGGMYVFTALGITVGFHRLLAHRSFAGPSALRYAFAVLGSMAVQGPVLDWVADHRKHHQFTDKEGDPHSPHTHESMWRGLLYAHMGWLMDTNGQASKRRYARDLLEDPGMRRINRLFGVWVLLGLLIPFALGWAISGALVGGLTALLWGGLVRVFLLHHITWSINSVCHFAGTRRFRTPDESRNVAWLALPSLGESWHHNHHAFPRSSAMGLRWYELDVSALVIRTLAAVGLAREVVTVDPERQRKKLAVAGDAAADTSPADAEDAEPVRGEAAQPAAVEAASPRAA